MKEITLNITEFINFKTIYKSNFNSRVVKGLMIVTANKENLALLGY